MPVSRDCLLLRVNSRLVAAVAAVAILALAALGHTSRQSGFHAWAEGALPTWFSASLLLSAAVLALELSRGHRHRPAWALRSCAAFLLAVAITELFNLHGRLETATGIDWKLLYAPLAAFGAVALVGTLRATTHGPARVLLLAGAGAWVAAQGVERLEYWNRTVKDVRLILPEELLEMAGSSLLGLALLVALQAALAARPQS